MVADGIIQRVMLVAVVFLGAMRVSAGCKKMNYLGWNTDFVNIYNTQAGVESPGDLWTWHANVTDANKNLKGELTGFCTRVPAGFWECLETIMFPEGHVFCHYVQKPPATSSTSGITGGTEDYKQANGEVVFTAPSTDDGPWGIDMEICTPSDTSASTFGQVESKVTISLAMLATAALAWI